MDEWRVHVGIKLVRAQMGLDRWNEERADKPANCVREAKVEVEANEAVAEENEDIKVVKVNVDNAQDIAMKYQVMSIPTTVIIKNGQEIDRAVGMMSKSDLAEMVK